MRMATVIRALGLTVTGLVPSLVEAQCTVEFRKPFQLNSAVVYHDRWARSGFADEKPKHLRAAMTVLTERPDKIDNQPGRLFLLGKTYALWLRDPEQKMTAKRSALGVATTPDQDVDIVAEMTAAFDEFEKLAPACADSTAIYRRQMFGPAFNAAIAAYNAKQFDSAAVLATRALQVFPRAPQAGNAYQIMASAAQARGDMDGMASIIERMKAYPAVKDARLGTQFNLGILMLDKASSAPEGERAAMAKRAAGIFEAYLAEAPDGPSAAQARSGMARALQATGDSTAIAGVFADMVNNTAKYTDRQLFEAATGAASARRYDDAMKLFEAGLAKNTVDRDALFNAANTYMGAEQYEKMLDATNRLNALDPNDPNNVRLRAAAYQRLGRKVTDPKLVKAYQDSTIKLIQLSQSLSPKVAVRDFRPSRGANPASLSGSVENAGTTVGNFTLTVEFLALDGAVVATAEAKLEGMAAGESKEFAVTGAGAGIAGWRYRIK